METSCWERNVFTIKKKKICKHCRYECVHCLCRVLSIYINLLYSLWTMFSLIILHSCLGVSEDLFASFFVCKYSRLVWRCHYWRTMWIIKLVGTPYSFTDRKSFQKAFVIIRIWSMTPKSLYAFYYKTVTCCL